MKRSKSIQHSFPDDIAFKIASSLQVLDLCALGSCSRSWRKICGSNCLWEALCRDRWPDLGLDKESSAPEINTHQLDQHMGSTLKGWRGFYIIKHSEMAGKAAIIVEFVERCLSSESIEAGQYLTAIEDMCSMKFGFKDVELFFLKANLHVLLNLVGLHYCIAWLGVPAEYILEALISCKISERQVCVQWRKVGGWIYRCRLQDVYLSRRVSLRDLAMAKEEEVLQVLHRGAVHEVLRVQISAAKP